MEEAAAALEVAAAALEAAAVEETSARTRRHFLVWKVVARSRLEALEDAVKVAERSSDPLPHKEYLSIVKPRLEVARVACEPDTGILDRLAGVVEWFTGAAQERAWAAIHEADVLLTYVRIDEGIRGEFPVLKQTIRDRVSGNSEKQELLDAVKANEVAPAGGTATTKAVNRETIAGVKQRLYALSDRGYEEKRSFRNIVIFMLVFVTAVAGLLAIPAVAGGLLNPLLSTTAFTDIVPVVWQVELVGALAGSLVAVTSLSKLGGLRGPYSLPFVQAGLKIPMGALTGLIGGVIIQSGEATIGPATSSVMFFTWVFVFGGAQQLITRFVDQKAKTVLEESKPGT